MSWLEVVVLGIVQGLTEFLPISSSAHLRIVSGVFFGNDPGAAFTAVSQLGTEAAVLVYYCGFGESGCATMPKPPKRFTSSTTPAASPPSG